MEITTSQDTRINDHSVRYITSQVYYLLRLNYMPSKLVGFAIMVIVIVVAIALYFAFVDDKVLEWKAAQDAASAPA